MFSVTLELGKQANANHIGNKICHREIRMVCTDACGPFFSPHTTFTCPWSYQPAVEEAPSNRIVED